MIGQVWIIIIRPDGGAKDSLIRRIRPLPINILIVDILIRKIKCVKSVQGALISVLIVRLFLYLKVL